MKISWTRRTLNNSVYFLDFCNNTIQPYGGVTIEFLQILMYLLFEALLFIFHSGIGIFYKFTFIT